MVPLPRPTSFSGGGVGGGNGGAGTRANLVPLPRLTSIRAAASAAVIGGVCWCRQVPSPRLTSTSCGGVGGGSGGVSFLWCTLLVPMPRLMSTAAATSVVFVSLRWCRPRSAVGAEVDVDCGSDVGGGSATVSAAREEAVCAARG